MWLLYASCAWVAGIFLGSKVGLPLIALSLGILPFLLIPLLPNSKKTLIVVGLCLLALIGGGLRFPSSLPQIDEHSLCFYNDKGVAAIQGVVVEEPDIRDRFCLLTLSVEEATVNGERERVSGTVLVRAPRYPAYHYGDVLQVTGKLETPPQFEDFDYRSYLARQGIYSVIYYPRVELLDRGKSFKPLHWIYSLREHLSNSLARSLPEPQGSLAQGILLGMRSNIPDSLTQMFSRTGTAHLLAISGLHVSIVIGMLLSLGVWAFGRQRPIYIWLAFSAIWLYALLTGMRPPVMRAAIMGSLFLMAEYLGRQRSAITALSFAATVMVGIQPQLLWSVSFQLSFLAMTGLIFLYPYFQVWGRKGISTMFGDREAITATGNMVTDGFAVTLAAIIAVWPLVAYNFGVVSLVGLPATFFSLPALPAIIVTSALVAFAGLLAPLAAQVLSWLAWLFLSYLMLVVQGFDSLTFSSFAISAIHSWQVWGYYVVLVAIMGFINYRKRWANSLSQLASEVKKIAGDILKPRLAKKWLIPPLLVIAILIWAVALTMPDDKLHVSFLDVGQGDAILIQTPSHQNILVDGGPSPQAIDLELSQKLSFWDRTIDLMVSTQPHADHVTGLVEVLQRYNVNHVLEPGVPYDSPIYLEWLNLVKEKQIKHEIARAGREIDLGKGIKMEVLNPPERLFEETSSDVDNNGVVLRLNWGEISFLFTADIREEAEFELIGQRANLKNTVLKVAHHGSKTSTSPQFLATVDPEIAVISVGADNHFGHPSPEVVERLVNKLGKDKVYRTDEQGTIEFITDGEKLWVRVER
jgi:DNA internalization-related competence protein ComEC/Rec2